MSQAVNVTSPVGRLVRGSLYKPNDKDAEGKPLVVKSGPQAGQPRQDWFFAVAIPKGAERHWAETPWGAEIWKVGHAAFPQAAQAPSFAWKVVDGDSQTPNKKGKKPCDNEGYKGNWVVHFSSGYAPNIYKLRDGTRDQFDPFNEPDAIKLGYYVQVNFTCAGNGSQSQPGVFLNHRMICFSAYGTEIIVGPDVASAGFGAAPLPAGASVTPPAGSFGTAPAPLIPGATPAPLPPTTSAPVPVAPVAPIAAAPIAVTPNTQFVQVPGVPVATPPAPPVVAPAAPTLVMTAAANGATYDQYRAAGWTDEQMLAQGVAVRAA